MPGRWKQTGKTLSGLCVRPVIPPPFDRCHPSPLAARRT
jgi:hypothetical protein